VDADFTLALKLPYGITVTNVHCITGAVTSAVMDFQECSSTGTGCASVDAAITCDSDGAADDGVLSNSLFDSGDWVRFDMGAVTGAVDFVCMTVYYTVNRE
jgi:hypothetical protein